MTKTISKGLIDKINSCRTEGTNLYVYDQNNSFGVFDVSDKLAPYVVVEAFTVDEAIEIGLNLGIYFNGVDEGIDCDCCGDRWYMPRENVKMDDIISYVGGYNIVFHMKNGESFKTDVYTRQF